MSDGPWVTPGPTPLSEFVTTADLWAPKASAFGAMRKLQAPQQRKKGNDKRESLADGSPKRLREKSSWLGMSKGYAASPPMDGQWIRVRCVLAELDDRECRLTIVGDKETLQHCLNVRLLRSTDIRFADRSLFFRNDTVCISAPSHAFTAHSPSLLFDPSGRRATPDPIYLAFETSDAANSWNAILRSYAVPEIYGCELDGRGLFRMWRQLSLTVSSARNLAIAKKNYASGPDLTTMAIAATEEVSEAAADLQMYCEIVIDGVLLGRTALQKGLAENGTSDMTISWSWHETFTLADLPPFGVMSVRVWRHKKGGKPMYVGTVEVVLVHFRRGQAVDGWFPIMYGTQVGDLRMKLKVDEERILSSEAYAGIMATLDQHNCLDLLNQLDSKLRVTDISPHMLALAIGRGTFINDILNLAEREVDNAPNANTLFRGNSIFTKTVEQAMTFFGRPFLEASVGPPLQDLCFDKIEIETDPNRNQKGQKDVEASGKLLVQWCERFWNNILMKKDYCPTELRRLFQAIRELVEKRFGDRDDVINLKFQSVSAFCFLRLIVPAILHPHLWGLHPGMPTPALQRSLTLIAKVLQSLANLSKEKKELHMGGVALFLETNRPIMIEYIQHISTVPAELSARQQQQQQQQQSQAHDKYDKLGLPPPLPSSHLTEVSRTRLLILRSLQARRKRARTDLPLHAEAIPVLPHLLDIPRHLAVVSSAVIRQTRAGPQTLATRAAVASVPQHDPVVDEFALRCVEIEERVLHCVNKLRAFRSTNVIPGAPSSPSREDHGRSTRPGDGGGVASRDSSSPGSPGGPDADLSSTARAYAESPRPSRKSAGKRPQTAPARSSSTDSSSPNHIPLPSSPPLRALRAKASDDSGASSPPLSPMTRYFGHQPSASASLSFSDTTGGTATIPSDTEHVSGSLLSNFPQQQDTDATDPKRRKNIFGLFGRNQK